MSGVLTAIGLSAPAGLNAPLALLLAGLIARAYDGFAFGERFGFLESAWFLLLVATWLFFELIVDKLPSLGRVNDLVNTPARPAAAALLFAATPSPVTEGHAWPGAAAGLAIGIAVTLTKASFRRRLLRRRGPLADLSASLAEDAFVAVTVVLAFFAPAVAVVLLLLALTPMLRWGVLAPPGSAEPDPAPTRLSRSIYFKER